VIASMANLVFKSGIIVALGGLAFGRRALWPLGATLVAGAALLAGGAAMGL